MEGGEEEDGEGGEEREGGRMAIQPIIITIQLPTHSSWKYPGIIARVLGWRCGLRKSDHTFTDESRL